MPGRKCSSFFEVSHEGLVFRKVCFSRSRSATQIVANEILQGFLFEKTGIQSLYKSHKDQESSNEATGRAKIELSVPCNKDIDEIQLT